MRALDRRQALGLGALASGAFALGHWLRRGRPVGEDVSGVMDTDALAEAPGFPAEGPANPAVTMLVFSDYACGVCRAAEPRWRAAAAEAGGVRIVYRDWPILGPASRQAARAALAADRQGKHAGFHAALIASGRLDEAGLRAALAAAGGDWIRQQTDLATHGAAIDRLLRRTAQDALQLGLGGTPAFLIGPLRLVGSASERQFADGIARARPS